MTQAQPAASATEDGSITLLVAPLDSADAESACADLSGGGSPTRTDLLSVALSRSPDERLDAWNAHAGPEQPANHAIVAAGEESRSAAASADGGPAVSAGPLTIQTVADAGSPVDLGVVVTEQLAAWDGDGNRSVVCFHSLTDLIERLGDPRAFRFLHVLVGRLRTFGADAHFHVDPSAHDDGTIDRLAELVDDVVEAPDGAE